MEDKCLSFFKAASDPTRVQIMKILKEKEMCVSEICQHFNMTQPSVSHHLSILKNVGIINCRKLGKEVLYAINKEIIHSCCSDFSDIFKK